MTLCISKVFNGTVNVNKLNKIKQWHVQFSAVPGKPLSGQGCTFQEVRMQWLGYAALEMKFLVKFSCTDHLTNASDVWEQLDIFYFNTELLQTSFTKIF